MKDVVVVNWQGFTLVELTLVVALLSFLLASALIFYFYGLKAFNDGVAQADLQQNVRIAADYISRELRFAKNLELVSGQEVRYKKPQDGNLYVIKKKGREIVVLINNVENKIAYNIVELNFAITPGEKFIEFEVLGDDGNFSYGVKSKVYLKNAGEGGDLL